MSEGNRVWIRNRMAILKKQAGFAFNHDLFISILLCLISGRNKHLVLTAPPNRVNEISQMATQISRCIFGLTTVTTTCTPEQTRADLIDTLFNLKENVDTAANNQNNKTYTPAQSSSIQIPSHSLHTINSNGSDKSQPDSSHRLYSKKTSVKFSSGNNNDEYSSSYSPLVNPIDFNLKKRDSRPPFHVNRGHPSTPSIYANSISQKELLSHSRKEKGYWTISNTLPTRIASAVIVQELNNSHESVQALLLELIVAKELRIANVRYNIPKPFFLIIAVLPHGYNRLAISSQLMDRFFVSYSFEENMFSYPPQSSTISKSINNRRFALMKYEEIKALSEKANRVHVSIDINRYIRDIVVGIRTHPLVKGGLTARCSQDLVIVLKSLATLFESSFLTPDLVSIAAGKVFSHRLHILAISATDDEMEQEDMSSKVPSEIVEEVLQLICVPV